ncbi:MAG: serpin family protein, partial [Planctomycetes bacterium]|nr:serpin family protein [Planctomycetota bacterium]
MPTMIAAALLAMTQSPATQEPPRAQEQPAATAADGFGLELYRALDRAQPGKNLFFSPYSVAVALTMTAEGARDETAAEMLQVLHLPSPP